MSMIEVLLLVLLLALLGLFTWMIVTYVPMPHPIRALIVVIVFVLVVLLLLNTFGLLDLGLRFPRFHHIRALSN